MTLGCCFFGLGFPFPGIISVLRKMLGVPRLVRICCFFLASVKTLDMGEMQGKSSTSGQCIYINKLCQVMTALLFPRVGQKEIPIWC